MKLALFAATLSLALVAGCGAQPPAEPPQTQQDLTFHQKPQVTITAPALGAFVPTAADGLVDVAGTSKGSTLTVNGQTVQVGADGTFHARVAATPGLNQITARLHGLWGGEAQRAFVYGETAQVGAQLASAVLVRANAKALDDHDADLADFSKIAVAMLGQIDIMKYLRAWPPFTYDFGLGSVDIQVTSVDFAKDKTALDLSPKAVGAHADGSLSQLVLGLHLVVHFIGDIPANATVKVDTVAFDGDINAAFSPNAQVPDPANPGGFTTQPGIVASMGALAMQLGQLDISTDASFPGVDAFITWLANQSRSFIASTVSQQIQENAGNHFATALNQFNLPSTFDLGPYGVKATLAVTDVLDAQTAFDDQGVTLSASAGLSWATLPEGAPGADAPGSLVIGSATTTTFSNDPFSVSVGFDTMNQAAFSVWGQNGLVRTVYPGKKYLLFRLDDVVATPALPPVLLPTADGRVQVSLGDVVVTTALHTLFFDGPVKVTIGALADVALDIDPSSGALRMTLSGAPTIHIDVNNLLGVIPDALLAPLSDLLQKIAPTIVEKLVKPIEVPLPRLPLSTVIHGQTGSIGLGAPVTVAVDAAGKRVNVSGDLAVYQ